MKIGDRVKIPAKQTIGPCNASRCNAVVGAKMNCQEYLIVNNSREDERGVIVTCDGGNGMLSDFRLSDLELIDNV